jgi:subtilase family serine protease
VSALADPYTGFPVVQSDVAYGKKNHQLETGWGGTSLASPIFTAIWAIAQEKAGHPLGQAAPTLARMKTGLADVLPLNNANNLSGSLTDKGGTRAYSTAQIFAPLDTPNPVFVAALWTWADYDGATFGLSFGLDSSLTVTTGWDNVTGYGTPDGAFVSSAASGN